MVSALSAVINHYIFRLYPFKPKYTIETTLGIVTVRYTAETREIPGQPKVPATKYGYDTVERQGEKKSTAAREVMIATFVFFPRFVWNNNENRSS